MTPRDDPPAEHVGSVINQPQAREARPGQDPGQPSGRAGPSWARAQLAAQVQRLGVAPIGASPATEMQPRQLDTPQLPDLEAEP
jgi:hypothetical protein